MEEITVRTQAEFDEANKGDTPKRILIVAASSTRITVIETIHHVEAWESAHVEARESAHVVAWESAHVVAWGSAHVVAWGSAHVEARESAHVEARESAHVVARESAIVAVESDRVDLNMWHQSVAVLTACECKISTHGEMTTIIRRAQFLHTTVTFLECYPDQIRDDGRIELYKSVQEDETDFYSGKITYNGVVECPDWDPNPERQCGGGLHLSPRPELALSYNQGKIKRCLVHPDDIVVYGSDISKVRCRKVEVLPDQK